MKKKTVIEKPLNLNSVYGCSTRHFEGLFIIFVKNYLSLLVEIKLPLTEGSIQLVNAFFVSVEAYLFIIDAVWRSFR